MPDNAALTLAEPPPIRPVHAETDARLVELWLAGRGAHTRRAYAADAAALLEAIGRPLRAMTLGDLQDFAAALEHLAPASRARRISAVKSLFAFGHRLGYLAFDVGAALRLPAIRGALAERILDESDVARLIALERAARNHALLRLLYLAGLRLSEACGLRWRDARRRGDGGQITVFGKGGKTRAAVLLPAAIWRELAELRGAAADDAPMFRSRRGGPLDPSQVHRIVKAAARRAGLPAAVSAHWLRHCHVSHALDRGAPAHLIAATVGHADLRTTSRYSHARPGDSSARYLVG
jgi:integrase/recombinase XerD